MSSATQWFSSIKPDATKEQQPSTATLESLLQNTLKDTPVAAAAASSGEEVKKKKKKRSKDTDKDDSAKAGGGSAADEKKIKKKKKAGDDDEEDIEKGDDRDAAEDASMERQMMKDMTDSERAVLEEEARFSEQDAKVYQPPAPDDRDRHQRLDSEKYLGNLAWEEPNSDNDDDDDNETQT